MCLELHCLFPIQGGRGRETNAEERRFDTNRRSAFYKLLSIVGLAIFWIRIYYVFDTEFRSKVNEKA
jgi:hypothetical protein